MAHITGGRLLENIPRILPRDCSVEIKKNSWSEQPLFTLLTHLGRLHETERYRTFNMGVGLVLIGDSQLAARARHALKDFPAFKLYEIGQIVPGERKVRLCA